MEEELISLVRDRDFLFNTSLKEYRDLQKKSNAWEEIASELNIRTEECITKWKNLRTVYVREKKKLMYKSGNSGSKRRKWVFMDLMSFLDPHIKERRKFFANAENSFSLHEEDYDATEEMDDFLKDPEDTDPPDDKENNEEIQIIIPGSEDKKNKRRKENAQFLKSLEETDNVIKQLAIPKDSDLLFCESLAVEIRKVPEERKMELKIKLLQLIAEYQNVCENPCLQLGNKKEAVMVKRKSTTNEASIKKITISSNLGDALLSNIVQTSEKSANEHTQRTEIPRSTIPESLNFQNVKEESLSNGEAPSALSKNKPEETISENVQITNVNLLSSESISEIPSEEEHATKEPNEGFDDNFYLTPLDLDQRDKAFGSFVACELSDLRQSSALYTKTKQSILKNLTEAHFEQMSSTINS